ncbi:Nucleotide-diphospho-sugar transferase domain-containing protein [Caenorhabditis elegans]|uniref:Nucleotide-diphospho-sugar transferase domain-containing protein n=1 Tax=Caenorhabditis elegans TaxID=6239 RepID=O17853_CAEEL|nr:Nucleotide-diphospho-sugar transferase domain-containing protein [Caenorhabditis elegans]CAB07606.2 Nucleotide-diphospho-sugar transferase domain-containing protein [Caenorhabditis elegans]|eukprot:NP_507112.2 Uncharacterized protein CELE_F28G4.3 [Caenorhabditis elegans]
MLKIKYRSLCSISFLICTVILIAEYSRVRSPTSPHSQRSPVRFFKNGKNNCSCFSDKSGKSHNFCYIDPQNSSSIGKKFDCSYLTVLENLSLIDDVQPNGTGLENVVFVSAISENHLNQAMISIHSFYKLNPTGRYILYSLNLTELNIKTLKAKFKDIEIRKFNTDEYPKYVNNWSEYRFKPLIVAQALKEFPNIWWMDADVNVKKSHLKELFFSELKSNATIKNGENEEISPIKFFDFTGHSNYATLFLDVLTYFPTNSLTLLKNEKNGVQLGANTFILSRTKFSIEILKWWVLCALDKTCMSPPGAQVACRFSKDRYNDFANCFRFDQSVLNLLMLNYYQDHNKYLAKQTDFFSRV